MMKRKVKRQKRSKLPGIFFLACTTMLGVYQTVPAASSTVYSETIEGEASISFDTYLIMDKQANIPYADFQYEITAGEGIDYDKEADTFEILPGVDADKVTMAGVNTKENFTISFSPIKSASDAVGTTDTSTTNTQTETLPDSIDLDTETQKYVKKTATLDFSACQFPEPGIYRYVLTESNNNQGFVFDVAQTRIVDVYVTNVTAALTSIQDEEKQMSTEDSTQSQKSQLQIQSIVLYENKDEIGLGDNNGSNGLEHTVKAEEFVHEYITSDLTIRKEVSGNQASHDKYFAVTVSLTEATPNTIYTVSCEDASQTVEENSATNQEYYNKSNANLMEADAEGKASQTFYLHHGQEITIQGIAYDTHYQVSEDAEDYLQKVKDSSGELQDVDQPIDEDTDENDVKIVFCNIRDGFIPTGVIVAVAPFAILVLLGGAGVLFFFQKKKGVH
jgi:hypothetical protein